MVPFCIWNRAIKTVAEGVGFEPTVGCPTLDFESSALNRTQPPFLWICRANYRMPHGQCKLRWILWQPRWWPTLGEAKIEGKSEAPSRPKEFTNKNLSNATFLPHVVYPRASPRNNLLFATVHKLLPGLFTIFRMYSQSSTHSHFP
jgi:hypothetical protein